MEHKLSSRRGNWHQDTSKMQRRHILPVAAVVTVLVLALVTATVAMVIRDPTTNSHNQLRGQLSLTRPDPALCPRNFGQRPLLLVSLDGFRSNYLHRGFTPTIQALVDGGVTTSFMLPSYPTKTFPNHYTIVTGLYPETHGIVANKFSDPEFNETFSLRTDTKFEERWWGGEPIWNTLTRQGKKSATYFWPGSDSSISGQHPTFWYKFNGKIPFEERVQQVLEWLSLPEKERPVWLSLYFHQPDYEGHSSGPDSPKVSDQLTEVDNQMLTLMKGLAERDLTHCVNMILISDHGMADAGRDKIIDLVDYLPKMDMKKEKKNMFMGPFGRIRLSEESEELKLDIMRNLSCKRNEMRVYTPETLPKRVHYSNNDRIEDIVLDLDPGYSVTVNSSWAQNGAHGYDNLFPSMNALFVAYGPDFQEGLNIEPFQNLELYNLMCQMTGVTPAPNNGTYGSLHHVLRNPPLDPEPAKREKPPASIVFSDDTDVLRQVTGCEKIPDEVFAKIVHDNSATRREIKELEQLHLPWGVPHSDLPANLTLLYHKDRVTGYSNALKLPLWTSFTVTETPTEKPPSAPWSMDVRLRPNTSPSCTGDDLLPPGVKRVPLFPPAFKGVDVPSESPYLVSNGVSVSETMEYRWKQLVEEMLPRWVAASAPLNVILGPLFDIDSDSRPDDYATLSVPAVSSDLFAIFTRCQTPVTSLDLCPVESLDAVSYIFPQHQEVSNCLTREQYILTNSALVRDVETASGLTFFTALSYREHNKLALRIHQFLQST